MSEAPLVPGPVADLRAALADAARTSSALSAWLDARAEELATVADRLGPNLEELREHLAGTADVTEALHRAHAEELQELREHLAGTADIAAAWHRDLHDLVEEATATADKVAQLPDAATAEVAGDLRTLAAVVREGTAGARDALDYLSTVELEPGALVEGPVDNPADLGRHLLAARKVATLHAWRRNLDARREALHRGRVLARKVHARALTLAAGSPPQRSADHTGPPRRRYCSRRRFTPSRGEDPLPPRLAGCPTRGSYVAGPGQ